MVIGVDVKTLLTSFFKDIIRDPFFIGLITPESSFKSPTNQFVLNAPRSAQQPAKLSL